MPIVEARFGADLRLLSDLEHQNSRSPGSDLLTESRAATGKMDLRTVQGTENLQQALLLRFLTPLGVLSLLGHPDYGSGLFDLIGELNNDTTRNRAKLYVLQALAAEPRVKQVISVSVIPHKGDPTRIDITAQLQPIDSDTPLNLVFPFFLDGGVPR